MKKAEKERVYKVQPAPSERVLVCTICRLEPETCSHDPEFEDRGFLRKACIWCSDWQPPENVKQEVLDVR